MINEGNEFQLASSAKRQKMSAAIVPGEAESIENFEDMPSIANSKWNEHQEFDINVQWEWLICCIRVFSGSFYVHKTFGAILVHR